MAGGIERGAIVTINNNRRLSKSRKTRYSKLKELYIGAGNKPNISKPSALTPAQLAEGRKRAIAFYTQRNRRIYTQIVLATLAAISLVYFLIDKYIIH